MRSACFTALLLGLMCMLVLSVAAQERSSQTPPRPSTPVLDVGQVMIEPREPRVGEEITATVTIRNTQSHLVLANVRLIAPPQLNLLLPDAEQVFFLEAGASRQLKWRAKVARQGALALHVDTHAISDGRPLGALLPDIPTQAATALARTWVGTWASPSGFIYDAKLQVKVDFSGAVEGQMQWTVKAAPENRPDYADKIGASGIEYVWGAYNASSRVLLMEGYRRDDPKQILGLDRYRLTFTENYGQINGASWDHGTWRAGFSLSPQ